jgi:hypothetical protein
LGTWFLRFHIHKSIDKSVENGIFVSFPVGSDWAVTRGDLMSALASSSTLPVGDFCYW